MRLSFKRQPTRSLEVAQPAQPAPPPLSVQSLADRAASLSEQSRLLEADADAISGAFRHKLGLALPDDLKLDEMLRAAADGATDKITSKVAFRRHFIRCLMMHEANALNMKELHLLDAFITSLGLSTSTVAGGVALSAVRAKLRAIRDGTSKPDALRDEAAQLRAQVQVLREVATLTAELEAQEARLAATSGTNSPASVQLGHLVRKRNLRLGDVLAKWGDVNRNQFKEHIVELGVDCNEEAISGLFDLLDTDGGGTLEASELKAGLKLLLGASTHSQATDAEQRKKVNALRREVTARQAAVLAWEQAREAAREQAAQQAKAHAMERAKEAGLASLAPAEEQRTSPKAPSDSSSLPSSKQPKRAAKRVRAMSVSL